MRLQEVTADAFPRRSDFIALALWYATECEFASNVRYLLKAGR